MKNAAIVILVLVLLYLISLKKKDVLVVQTSIPRPVHSDWNTWQEWVPDQTNDTPSVQFNKAPQGPRHPLIIQPAS